MADSDLKPDFLIGANSVNALRRDIPVTASINHVEAAIESAVLTSDGMASLAAELIQITGNATRITAGTLDGRRATPKKIISITHMATPFW